jgi:hypothetical protein
VVIGVAGTGAPTTPRLEKVAVADPSGATANISPKNASPGTGRIDGAAKSAGATVAITARASGEE